MSRVLLLLSLIPSIVLAQGIPGGGVSLAGNNTWTATQTFAVPIKSSVAGGTDAISLTAGQKLHLGQGTNDSFYASSGNIFTDGNLIVGNSVFSGAFRPASAVAVLLYSSAPDGASAVAVASTSSTVYSTAGAKIHSFQNNQVEKASVDYNGKFITSVPSGADGFLSNTGARLHLGAGFGDYFYSDGTSINTPTNIFTGGALVGANLASYNGISFVPPGSPLPTCASGKEAGMYLDSLSGGSTGNPTRICMCSSNGAATPVYTWRNVITGTTGTATTCAN